jgi:hypothetical protein
VRQHSHRLRPRLTLIRRQSDRAAGRGRREGKSTRARSTPGPRFSPIAGLTRTRADTARYLCSSAGVYRLTRRSRRRSDQAKQPHEAPGLDDPGRGKTVVRPSARDVSPRGRSARPSVDAARRGCDRAVDFVRVIGNVAHARARRDATRRDGEAITRTAVAGRVETGRKQPSGVALAECCLVREVALRGCALRPRAHRLWLRARASTGIPDRLLIVLRDGIGSSPLRRRRLKRRPGFVDDVRERTICAPAAINCHPAVVVRSRSRNPVTRGRRANSSAAVVGAL